MIRDAIVRSATIYKIAESSRNDLTIIELNTFAKVLLFGNIDKKAQKMLFRLFDSMI